MVVEVSAEVAHEPVARQVRHALQRAGLLEEVAGARDDLEASGSPPPTMNSAGAVTASSAIGCTPSSRAAAGPERLRGRAVAALLTPATVVSAGGDTRGDNGTVGALRQRRRPAQRRRRRWPRALVVVAMLAVASPSSARAATVVVGDLARPGAQAAAVDRGPCDHPLTPDEGSGAVPSPCGWPAPDGDWGPPLIVGAGDTVEVDLDAPASAVRATVTTTAAPRRVILGPADLAPAGGDGRSWRVVLSVAEADLDAGSLGLALVVDGEAFTVTLNRPPPPFARPPSPPPLAFGHATLDPRHRSIGVTLMTTVEVAVTVVLSRQGRRVGRNGRTIRPGDARVRVPVGPRNRRRLRPGLHVDVAIYFGAPTPLRTRGVVLLRG